MGAKILKTCSKYNESVRKVIEPVRATKYSSAVDLFCAEDTVIESGETKLVPLGVFIDLSDKMSEYEDEAKKEEFTSFIKSFREVADRKMEEFKSSHYIALHPRSSLRYKKGLIVNTGIIDMDYTDEIKMVVHNPVGSDRERILLKEGARIAQVLLLEHKTGLLGANELGNERLGGFGSTGGE